MIRRIIKIDEETCTGCGLTRGDVLPHNWTDTTCTDPSPCTGCGTLEGIELTHQWSPEKGRLCTACGLDERPTEVRFMDYLGRRLDARWTYMGGKHWYSVKSKDTWTVMVNDEYDLICNFLLADFEDEELGKLAEAYINTVIETRDALVDFGTDLWVEQYYDGIRHKQNTLLYEINELYPISVKEEFAEELDELLVGGKEVALINTMAEGMKFHNLSHHGNSYRYEVMIENNTDMRFSSITYVIELYDGDGNVLTTKTYKLSPWRPGDSRTYSLYVNGKIRGERVVRIEWEV